MQFLKNIFLMLHHVILDIRIVAHFLLSNTFHDAIHTATFQTLVLLDL